MWTLKQGEVTQEDNRDAVCHCREEIHVAKARVEFKLSSTVKDNKRVILKHIKNKRRIGHNIAPLLDEVMCLTNGDIGKAETFNVFFTSVFNTDDVLEDCDLGDDKLSADSALV